MGGGSKRTERCRGGETGPKVAPPKSGTLLTPKLRICQRISVEGPQYLQNPSSVYFFREGSQFRLIIRGGTVTGGYGFGYLSDVYRSPL